MPAQILVGNLPPGTTPEEVETMFEKWGAEVAVEIREEGSPDRLTAVVTLEVDAQTARVMVDRAKGQFYNGRTLTFYAPLMMDNEDRT